MKLPILLAVALLPTAALAGNVAPAPAPVPLTPVIAIADPIYDWTGLHAGASIGYGDFEADDGGGGAEGAVGGIRVGYDRDFGRFVLGGRLDYAAGDIGFDDVDLDDLTRLGVRAGFDSGRNLYYGIAGYAHADSDEAGSSDGAFGGLGYEVFATDAVTIGAEVLYHDFDGFDDGADVDGATAGLLVNFRF